jgi:hypothetical protein
MIGAVFEAKKEIPGKGVSASTRRALVEYTRPTGDEQRQGRLQRL